MRETNRIHHQKARSNFTPEQFIQNRESNRIQQQAARTNLKPGQLIQNRESNSIQHQSVCNSLTPEQVIQNRERRQLCHHLLLVSNSASGVIHRGAFHDDINAITPTEVSCDIEIYECIRLCQSSWNRTLLTSEEDENDDNSTIHRMLVCIVCDQCIIGKDMSKVCTPYQQCPTGS